MPTHAGMPAESVAPQQRGEAPSPLDPLPQETKKKRAQMLSREAVMAILNGQISSLQEPGMTSAGIRDTMANTVLNRSAEPRNIKAHK